MNGWNRQSRIEWLETTLKNRVVVLDGAMGTMIHAVQEAIYAIEFGAEVGELASKVALEEAKLILSVWAGLHVSASGAAAGKTAPTVLEKASRAWAIDVGASIGKRTGEAVVASDYLTAGELLKKFATNVGSDVAVASICRLWTAGYGEATKGLLEAFPGRLGASTAEKVIRDLTLKTVTKTPNSLLMNEFQAVLATRISGEKVDAKAADEIIAKVVRTEAAKPWVEASIKAVIEAETQ